MPPERRAIQVYADWAGLSGPLPMGQLFATLSRGKEIFSFEYAPDWVGSAHAQVIDPALQLYQGPQYLRAGRDNFGAFLDSSPDRWGRVLLDRREAQSAREQGRKVSTLRESDYLLGVYDGHRMGALRFRIADGPFLDDNQDLASPPWTSLRELEQASLHLEDEGAEENPSYSKWLRMLIAPGRSLGGARPKASVLDPQNHLWIAKFPSRNDTTDVGGWESVVHALAQRAGIRVAEGQRQQFGSKYHTFLSKRFDRTEQGGRIHFASAMTLLERQDGEEGVSYLELAQFIMQQGAHPSRDLEELWRRIAFSVCVSNVDDHLRNHGFLLEAKGWSLAPAYDMNPVPTRGGLKLNISETDNAQDLDLLRDVATHFRLKPARAQQVLSEVITAVRAWREVALSAGISRSDQERMAPAFKSADGA
jgi:serine/threonine-protein kinase HipA